MTITQFVYKYQVKSMVYKHQDTWIAWSTCNMREVLTLQFGQFSNSVGAHYWNYQVRLVISLLSISYTVAG